MTPPFPEIGEAIAAHQTFLIAGHVGPDGDAIGSGLALKSALQTLGKKAAFVSSDGVPSTCRYLPDWEDVLPAPPAASDCFFVIDCDGTPNRLAAPQEALERAKMRIIIDHHRTSRPIFDINWIDPEQPATALMIYDLIRHLNVPISPVIAQDLLCGLSTDTGNFRFPNTSPNCLRAAGELVELGADPALTAFKLFDERSFAATKLLGLAIEKMQSECDGALTWTALSAMDFERSGTGDEGSENVVNILRNVRGARMALIFRERRDETGPVTRISVRCEPELRADMFCAEFGGGGHAAASGCRIRHKPFDESVQLVVSRAIEWLQNSSLIPHLASLLQQ